MGLDRSLMLAVGMLAALTTACNRNEVPGGQVITTVNGVEITVAELNEEARTRGLPISRDPALRGALLQELVDRKLLVQEALERKADRNPAYVLAKRRSDEILLAQQLLAGSTSAESMTNEQLSKVIAANPQAFGNRSVSTIDRLVVGGELPEPLKQQLLTAASVDAMERLIKAARLEPSRARVTLDGAEVTDAASTAILKLKAGERFAVQVPGGTIVGQVLATRAQPVPADKQLSVAREWLRRRQAQAVFDRILQDRRPKAKIRYQPGFEPVPALD